MALTTLVNVRAYLSPAVIPAADDALVSRLIDAESAWFEQAIGQAVAVTSYTETLPGDESPVVVLPYGPVVAIITVKVDGVAATYTRSGRIVTLSTPAYRSQTVEVVYTAGLASPTPSDIEQAVIEMVALKFRERGHVGNASTTMAGQSVSYLPSIIPASVQAVVNAYRRL